MFRIDFFSNFAAAKMNGVWRSWLAYLHGVQVVVRSSRITPTERINKRFVEEKSERTIVLSDFFVPYTH